MSTEARPASDPAADFNLADFAAKSLAEGLDYAICHYWGEGEIGKLEQADPELARDWREAAKLLARIETRLCDLEA